MSDDAAGAAAERWWLSDADARPALAQIRRAVYRLEAAERRLNWRHQRGVRKAVPHGRLLALLYLSSVSDVTPTELAREGHVNPARITAMAVELEGEGMVRRWRDGKDGRVRRIALTAKGRKAVQREEAVWKKRFQKAFESTSDEDLLIASAVIERLAAVFDAVDPIEP
jgi:DNA-binding MarR family transcriptional regulator